MSIEAAATLAAPIIERPVAYVSDASARHLQYLTRFKDNFECLRDKMNVLVALKEDVKTKIEAEETNQQMERTRTVAQWLESVEASQKEVDLILQKCSAENCPKFWLARYKLGKKVCRKLKIVADLISQGNFDVVVDKSRPCQVQVQPESRTIGLDAKFEEVWNWIGDVQAKIIGIYGMGGVGKTTLLKKINNKFEKEVSSFDLVIWVVVSSEFSMQNVQKQIMERLGLTSSDNQNIQAQRISNALSKKKFLVLLDDVWEGLDLEIIGIPSPYTCNNISKVVFTTRSEKVCGSMEANKKYKVSVLEWEQAWELFQQKVGEGTLSCDPEIPKLAKAVAEECGGLPLALITTGRAMSNKKTPREWNHALAMLKQYASRFEDDTARDCFLYCSLYPEDHDIKIEEIIYLWIGEGFFNEFEEFDMARDQGYAVIRTLKSACLLEMGSEEEFHVKLHDVVRDLALWIANECGEYRNKYLVQAGVGLSQAPKIEDWEGKERISLMKNENRELIGAPNCPRLVTLMLQRNIIFIIMPHYFCTLLTYC
ncbi:mitogen-activated protein kinase kinase [Ranunculus cassubicifolius]